MLFHTGQILNVSGPLNMKYLQKSLEFGLDIAGRDKNTILTFQITTGNKYCVGWKLDDGKIAPNGWTIFPPGYDDEVIANAIKNYLSKFECTPDIWDGKYEQGFLMKAINNTLDKKMDDIINPFYGDLSFEPFTCFYAK